MRLEEIILMEIIHWLYSVNAQFGVDHIVINNHMYWFDSQKDMDDLYELFENYK